MIHSILDPILDSLLFKEKYQLLNYIFGKKNDNSFDISIKLYFENKLFVNGNLMGIFLFDDNKRKKLFIYNNITNNFVLGENEDERDLAEEIKKKYLINENMYNDIVGFLDIDNKTNSIIFKVKDTTIKRNKGSVCNQAGKAKNITILNKIFNNNNKFTKDNTKKLIDLDLCIYQNFALRYFQKINKYDKIWFFDFEKTNIYGF